MDRKTLIIIGLVAFIILAGCVTGSVFASINNAWGTVRDVAIVVLALTTILSTLLLGLALLFLAQLALMIRSELKPILQSIKDTTRVISGTTTLATDFVIAPGVRAASAIIGAQQVISVLFGKGKARDRAERRRERRLQQEAEARGEA